VGVDVVLDEQHLAPEKSRQELDALIIRNARRNDPRLFNVFHTNKPADDCAGGLPAPRQLTAQSSAQERFAELMGGPARGGRPFIRKNRT
jgi:hypothetical protein